MAVDNRKDQQNSKGIDDIIEDEEDSQVGSVEMVSSGWDDEWNIDDFIEDDDSEDVTVDHTSTGSTLRTRPVELTLPDETFRELDRLIADTFGNGASLSDFLELLSRHSAAGFREMRSRRNGCARRWLQEVIDLLDDPPSDRR
jgi:hypothetical protein